MQSIQIPDTDMFSFCDDSDEEKEDLRYICCLLWSLTNPLSLHFSGPLYFLQKNTLAAGCVDGKVLLLYGPYIGPTAEKKVLETKAAAPVTALIFHDVAGIGTNDVVAGSADGQVAIFLKDSILARHNVGSCVTCITADSSPPLVGGVAVFCGDTSGTITAVDAHSILWRVKIPKPLYTNPAIKFLHVCTVPDSANVLSHYLLAARSDKLLYICSGEKIVFEVEMPANITAVYSGDKEIFVACEDCCLCSLDFRSTNRVHKIANTHHVITCICKCRFTYSGACVLLCGGYFNGMQILAPIPNSLDSYELVLSVPTGCWVTSIAATYDLSTDKMRVAYLQNQDTVRCYTLKLDLSYDILSLD